MTTSRSNIERFLAQDFVLLPPIVPRIHALHRCCSVKLGFFSPGQRAGQRAWMDRDSKTLPDRFSDVPAGGIIRSPLLHEIQDLVRALVRSSRTSRAGQKADDAALGKSSLGHIERLSAHPEGGGHIGYRLPIDLAPSQHFITHLHQIAGIKELILPERLIPYLLRVRVKRSVLAEAICLGIGDLVPCAPSRLYHKCQLYYVPSQIRVKLKM
jgi:hypothetical protein